MRTSNVLSKGGTWPIAVLLLTTCNLRLATVSAQQLHLNNQFLVNSYVLSPAFAGFDGKFRTFAMYRQDWIGFEGAPEVKMVNTNGPINDRMGIGGTVSSDRMGIFRNFSASLSYAYHLKLNDNHGMSFALSAGVFDSNIELSGGTGLDQLDPVALNNARVVSKTSFDIGFGGVYQWKKFRLSGYLPRLLESKVADLTDDKSTLYTLRRHAWGALTYRYDLGSSFTFDPWVVIRRSQNSPALYDIALKTTWNDMAHLGLGYRKGGVIVVSLGGNYKSFVLNYSYELSGQGMLAHSDGTHEISLGYTFGGAQDKADVPKPTQKRPYYEWVD